jgi:hypothetical protein
MEINRYNLLILSYIYDNIQRIIKNTYCQSAIGGKYIEKFDCRPPKF